MLEVEIGDLSFDAILALVRDILNSDENNVLELADLCFQKTHGNPFFTIFLLKTIHERGLLVFALEKMRWAWNVEDIMAQVLVSDNVVDILKTRMKLLDPYDLHALQLAACLGFEFSARTLQSVIVDVPWKIQVVSNSSDHGESSNDGVPQLDEGELVLESLERLLKDGYIDLSRRDQNGKEGGGEDAIINAEDLFQFSHDQVQSACLDLFSSDEERDSLSHCVGQSLWKRNDPSQLDAEIFVVANLLNRGEPPSTASGRQELAKINAIACEKAFQLSTFEAAAEYAQAGISLLEDNRWVNQKDLALKLFSIGARAESFLGNGERVNLYCGEVFTLSGLPMADQLSAYNAKIEYLFTSSREIEAANLAEGFLKHFGIRFPKGKLATTAKIILGALHSKKLARKWCKVPVADQPIADPLKEGLMVLNDFLCRVWFRTQDDRMVLAFMKSFELTVKYGLSLMAPVSTATMGLVFFALNDLKLVELLARKAMELVEVMESGRFVEGMTVSRSNGMLLFCLVPYHQLEKPLLRGYECKLQHHLPRSGC